MPYLGDILAGTTIRFLFDTAAQDGSGLTLSGTPAIRAYKNNSTTESSSGLSLTVDFDSRTGLHLVEIDLSSDGTFYAAGSDVMIVLTAGTVNSINVFPKVLAQLSIVNRSLALDSSGRVTVGAIANGVIAAATFAANALDAVWSTATRLLTAGTNIVLAKGIGVTGLNDIAASAIIDDATPFHGASIAAIKAKTDNLPASPAATTDIPSAATIGAQVTSDHGSGSYVRNTEPDNTDIAAIKLKTDNLPASPAAVSDIPTANQNADALLDRTDAIETGFSPRGSFRLMLAALAGKLSGAATSTITIRNAADSKDRITATVDADGNRSAITTDIT